MTLSYPFVDVVVGTALYEDGTRYQDQDGDFKYCHNHELLGFPNESQVTNQRVCRIALSSEEGSKYPARCKCELECVVKPSFAVLNKRVYKPG